MSHQPFSVAMAVYKGDDPLHFRMALDSILQQTRVPDEIVLVVDGPVPPALDTVIQDFSTEPIAKVIRLPENRGHGGARNTGLLHCQNDFVALADADDINCPDRFEKQMAKMEADPDLAIIGGAIAEFIGEPTHVVSIRDVCISDTAIKADMKKRCPMNQMTVLFRRSAVEAAGGYLDFYCNEDYYLWVRMQLQGAKFANLPDILVKVRVGEDMYRRRGGMRYFRSEARLQKIMRKHRIIGPFTYAINVTKRFLVQVCMPARVRGFVFRHFARKSAADAQTVS